MTISEKMKVENRLEMMDDLSNHSDFSTDSQSSEVSARDLRIEETVALLTPGNENITLLTSGMFITLEGLNSGVPTRTTPTLTPTTLRSIEQTFIELQSKPETHENEAGFVPPMVHSIGNNQYISVSDANDMYSSNASKSPLTWHSSLSQSSSDSNMSTPPLSQKTHLVNNTPQGTTRRNMGGRKPARDLNLSPEEEEKRRIRRERNKAAAARCRKRRVDLTNQLIKEVEEQERKREKLLDERSELIGLKQQLELALQHHKENDMCRLATQSPPDIKPFEQNNDGYYERVKTEAIEHSLDTPNSDQIFLLPDSPVKKLMLSSAVAVPISRPNRPNSLNVATNKINDLTGMEISTPSAGMFSFINFDSMMSGGTGLTPGSNTPLIPSCSSQQRFPHVSIADLASPDNGGPPKLVSL